MPEVNIVTFNARGLRLTSKRRAVFRHFHRHYPNHVIVLQESHSSERDHSYWQAEWGSPIYLSHGPSSHDGGVAVLLPRSLTCDVTVLHNGNDGRLLVLGFDYGYLKIALFAVYAPTQGHGQQQLTFLSQIKERLEVLATDGGWEFCIAGDFNIQLSSLDVQGGRFRNTKSMQTLSGILADYSLVDVWRKWHANTRRYTWRKSNPIQGSRIDYVFVSQSMVTSSVIRRVEIKPCISSDHSLVNLQMCIYSDEKGRGLFRFDNHLLDDDDFVQTARQEILKVSEGQGIYEGVDNLGLKIEMLLSEIRVLSIKLSKHKAIERREEYNALIGNLDKLDQEIRITQPLRM